MKKYILILVVLLTTMLAVGCTGSNSEKSTSQAGVSQPTSSVDQDSAWKHSFMEDSYNVNLLLDNIQTDERNIEIGQENKHKSNLYSDEDTLNSEEQLLVDYTQRAMNNNNNYTVSPKYQEAQKEWGLALQDYYDGGKYLISVTTENENNGYVEGKSFLESDSTDSIKQKSLFNSGENHMQKAQALAG